MRNLRNWGEINKRLETASSSNGGSTADARQYKPKFAKDGTFEAVIRFLPAPGDELPIVKKFAHRFKDRGGDFHEECLTTIGQKCPVCEVNSEAWQVATEDVKKSVLRPRSRQTSGVSNILVISDPQCPTNNGKVFIYRYGKTIFEKVTDKCFPDEKKVATGVAPVNVFDYYEGANFRLSGAKKSIGGNVVIPKYDNSSFDAPSVIGDEAFIDSIEKQLFSLKEFLDPAKFKSYDEIKSLFNKVRGITGAPAAAYAPAPVQQASAAPAPAVQQAPQPAPVVSESAPVQKAPAAPAPVVQPTPQPAAPAPIVNAAPAAADPSLNFNAIEDQSEDDFWNSIKKK